MKKPKEKPKKIHSLRHQITAYFIGLLFLSILTITVINGVFLEKYYVSKKMDVLMELRDTLECTDIDKMMNSNETEGSESIPDAIQQVSSKNNLSWVIVDSSNTSWLSWGENEKMLQSKLFGYVYDLDEDGGKSRVLKKEDDYTIQQSHDRFSGMDYVECWGTLGEDHYFIIRTPLESIRESANISNKFYFVVGLAIIILSGIMIMLVTKRITRPISELTELSRKMSDLDFEARYKSNVGNEIDVLGDNFNRMSTQLENTISELKSANNELQRDIEDKIKIDKMRKEFLDNVSHELKTPIALVQGYAEGLKENISDDPESREFYCDVIMDEAAKMNKLVKNLLTLNQLESGKDAVVMERFDIVSLIRGVLQTMNIMIGQKEAKVIFDAEKPVYVWADEFKTEEVVTNYVSNALNHLDGDKEIEIKLLDKDSRVKVTVFNTGTPIPEADVPNLWNKFYKVDKARTREYGGSGIGLSIVKAIMESMNQEYGVQNFDNGVEFWFTLDRK
uniref:histidine kinase n=1 Tax=Blautia aquisgranensis TaxID=3133153 RepID=A0ABV1BE36_9FIRM